MFPGQQRDNVSPAHALNTSSRCPLLEAPSCCAGRVCGSKYQDESHFNSFIFIKKKKELHAFSWTTKYWYPTLRPETSPGGGRGTAQSERGVKASWMSTPRRLKSVLKVFNLSKIFLTVKHLAPDILKMCEEPFLDMQQLLPHGHCMMDITSMLVEH